MTGIINAYSVTPFVSGWNPNDKAAQGYPSPTPTFPAIFSNANRTLTRNSSAGAYDPGVRGTRSNGSPGQKWYVEFKVASLGTNGVGNQYFWFGLIPTAFAMLGSDISAASDWLIVTGNGACYSIVSGGVVLNTTLGVNLAVNDVIGMDWEVGTSARVYLNNVLNQTSPTGSQLLMSPFFGAGSTLSGPDSSGTGESLILQANALNQTYSPPAGYTPWG